MSRNTHLVVETGTNGRSRSLRHPQPLYQSIATTNIINNVCSVDKTFISNFFFFFFFFLKMMSRGKLRTKGAEKKTTIN
jgi:hypothetical protein